MSIHFRYTALKLPYTSFASIRIFSHSLISDVAKAVVVVMTFLFVKILMTSFLVPLVTARSVW